MKVKNAISSLKFTHKICKISDETSNVVFYLTFLKMQDLDLWQLNMYNIYRMNLNSLKSRGFFLSISNAK